MRTRPVNLTDREVRRFWSKVAVGGPDDCWPWLGEHHRHGYGFFSTWKGDERTSRLTTHRVSAFLAGMDIEGLVVRHDCDNPPCVNPAHLRTGIQADNMHDAVARGRMDMSGLELGWTYKRPERPCATCKTILPPSRATYCAPCRVAADRASKRKYVERKKAERRGLSANQRIKILRRRAA